MSFPSSALPHTAPSPIRLARRSAEFIRGRRAQVAGIAALALVIAVLGAVDPLIIKYLFDALGDRRASALPYALAALLGVELGRNTLGRWLGVLTWDVRIAVDFDMRR